MKKNYLSKYQTLSSFLVHEKLSKWMFMKFLWYFFGLVGNGYPSFLRKDAEHLMTNKTLSNRFQTESSKWIRAKNASL